MQIRYFRLQLRSCTRIAIATSRSPSAAHCSNSSSAFQKLIMLWTPPLKRERRLRTLQTCWPPRPAFTSSSPPTKFTKYFISSLVFTIRLLTPETYEYIDTILGLCTSARELHIAHCGSHALSRRRRGPVRDSTPVRSSRARARRFRMGRVCLFAAQVCVCIVRLLNGVEERDEGERE